MSTTTPDEGFVNASIHLRSGDLLEVTHTEPGEYRPNGLAHVRLGFNASLVIKDPAVALALADALQDAARVLRRNQLQAMTLKAAS